MEQKILKGSHSLMKDLNESSILNIILNYGPISRADIAQKLQVSIPTATRITDSLLSNGLIVNTGYGSSSGGRKAPIFEINPEGAYMFGAHIGSELDIILTNLKAEILDTVSYPADLFEEPEDIIKKISSDIDRMLLKNKIPESKVYGVGIGTPGVNFRAKPRIETSVFKGWNHIDIENLLQKYMRFKTYTENIAYTSTLKEYWFGAGKGYGNVVHLMVDNGIGGGVIINGRLYKGINGKAGIFGHISVESNGEECYCGNKGCVEVYSSIPAIVKRTKELMDAGVPSSMATLHKSGSRITFEDISREAELGDLLAGKVLKEAGEKLGSVIASLVNTFDPELVILSGEVVKRSPLLFEKARTEVAERIFSFLHVNKLVEIKPGNEQKPTSLGCIALVMQLIFETHRLL